MTDSIQNRIIPGNYWLTKSMEFNRVLTSGTLWYLKKWIVYYTYVFLRQTLFQRDYDNISCQFDSFIESLPPQLRDTGRSFFYSPDIRDENFITFDQFSNNRNTFNNESDQIQFFNSAKRYYFMYLMNSGGQSGWKRRIKEKILETKCYQATKINIETEMRESGLNETEIRTELSDYPAPIRNERQIYFYYGIFHGSDQANLDGFYNLTRVGKAILSANFDELVLIWEHQKIKMISQSPVSEIKNLPGNYEHHSFSINIHPYRDLLTSVQALNPMSLDEYQYGISRSKTNLPADEIIEYLLSNRNNIEGLQRIVAEFNRTADMASEDFRKELLKYILGISNLPKDQDQNPYALINYLDSDGVSILDSNKLTHTLKIYNHICQYLDNKYSDEYQYFCKKTSENYQNFLQSGRIEFDPASNYRWPVYIINFDENVFIYLVYWSLSLLTQNYSFELEKGDIERKYNNYKNLLTGFSIKKRDFVTLVMKAQVNLVEEKIDPILSEDENPYDFIPDDPSLVERVITLQQIEEISDQSASNDLLFVVNRNRNAKLIQLMKSYYSRNYSDMESKLIKCDCCNQFTFLTYNDSAYLEFHHLIPFNQVFGPDHFLNLFFICPICHRKLHFAKAEIKTSLYENLSSNNQLDLNMQERIQDLYNKGLLEAIHLDFLLAEGIINKNAYDIYLSEQRVRV